MKKLPAHFILTLIALLLAVALAPLGPASAATVVVFDDMEHGNPFGNGWFAFNGAVGGGGIGPNSADLPPSFGGSFSLETGWGSGGTPGFYGGFGRTNPIDLSSTDTFNLWINPNAGQAYTLEINLQEDDNGDSAINQPDDDEFQFNCVVSASGPCAISGDGWQQISIPLADFFDDNSFLFGGNGVLDAVPVSGGGNGQLINVVIAVIGTGSDVNFRTDYWAFSNGPLTEPPLIVDDFESGLPSGTDGNGNAIGFSTFQDANSTVAISTTDTPPAAVPGAAANNHVLAVSTNVNGNNGFAGVIHAFENAAVNTWTPQDWSRYEGISFWLYGNNTNSILFIDILDNRAFNTTGDTAERYSRDIIDDFSGWRYFEIPFESLRRKEVGNGAPNDGLTLTQVHGWAFGVFDAGQPFVNYIDDVAVYGNAEVPELAVGFQTNNYNIPEGGTGSITVKLNRPMGADDPAEVTVHYSVETVIAEAGRDFVQPAPGTLTFTQGGPSELSFTIQTLDDNKYEGDERLILHLSDPVGAAPGFIMQASATILDNENFDPLLLDDFERYPYLWDASPAVTLDNPEIAAGDSMAVPGQGAYEHVLAASLPLPVDIAIQGRICNKGNGVIPVALLTTPDFNALDVNHTTVTLGNAHETHIDKKTGLPVRHVEDVDRDGDRDLVFHFRFKDTGLTCDPAVVPFNGQTSGGQAIVNRNTVVRFGRDFALGQDWSASDGLTFYYYGQGTGDTVTVELKDNRAPDPGPSGWSLVWSDEFNDPAGTPPNPANWAYEIGDGTVNGIPGWGNSELQYYTNSTDNVATDGNGNLVITAREANGSLDCYYGPCEYTSARLISWHKAEFAYGRIESRILVPPGEDGLWPAFWSLGTDIDVVDWPQTGEIDIMEYVSRIPNEVFGTIHGPGYAGGNSYGDTYTFPGGVAGSYHTFSIEWQPNLIKWYVDGILYHSATPADVAPNQWVFNDPVFLLFNMAIGGNFGGSVSPDLTFPQKMTIDYVRVYQGPDTAERFSATFVDNFTGWQKVEIPFSAFSRSSQQPVGAPNDGLTLTDVWGYGFRYAPNRTTETAWLDQVRLAAQTEVTVTNANNSGPGSLREAINAVANGGTVLFAPSLANTTITLTSGPLVVNKAVTIDGSAAPGLVVSGGNTDRVLIVDAAGDATLRHLTIADGYGYQLAGGVLNNGALSLDHVTVRDNLMTTDAGDFWQGGGGIYNGDGATLSLIDSTVADNTSGWAGGGVYSFFNTTTTVVRSTISGNVSIDVGGGMRLLGNASITNSTLSGNTSTAWHGGAIFSTDGVVTLVNSTIVGNSAPSGTAGGLFVGTFGPAAATLTLQNTIVAHNGDFGCFQGFFGGGAVTLTSLGNNLFTDGTCNPVGSDQIVANAGVGALANNGGPTLTRALLAGSGAIGAANTAVCPATDQRGVSRDAACDVGAFEFVP